MSRGGLLIKAAGACCAVGYQLTAATCAIRAGMDHFQESAFVDRHGEPVLVAQIPIPQWQGAVRLGMLARYAIRDCLGQNAVATDQMAVYLLAAETERPHSDAERYHAIWHAMAEAIPAGFHAASRIIPSGRAGLAACLRQAQTQLETGVVQNVLVVAVDSLLDSATIGHFLAQDRLQTPKNADGFIPGEAAAAIWLQCDSHKHPGVYITGVGSATEAARFGGDLPNRAFGLTTAMRGALSAAQRTAADIDFRWSDQNGESWYAKEIANAWVRVAADGGGKARMMQLADCVGETGAAAGVLSLALMQQMMPLPYSPGQIGLLHLANDNGLRTACTVEYIRS